MHNFSKIWKTVLVLAICVACLGALDFALYPCTFMRNDIHSICTKEYDDLILGTSHGKMNIDPDTMEEINGRKGHNICVGGEYGVDAYYIARLAKEKGNYSRIIYEADPGYFITEKEEGNNYLLFYHEFPLSKAKIEYFAASIAKCNFRTVLFPWYEYSLDYEIGKMKDTIYQKWNKNYDVSYLKSSTQEYHESGFVERYAVDVSKIKRTSLKVFDKNSVNQDNVKYLKKLIQFCKEEGIEFVAVSTPVPKPSLDEYEKNYEEAWDYFAEFFAEEGVEYYNFNREYMTSFSHKMKCFTDFDGHMNGDAARAYSKVLAEILDGGKQ